MTPRGPIRHPERPGVDHRPPRGGASTRGRRRTRSAVSSRRALRRADGSFCGTGRPAPAKTTALRALSREWQSWCSVHYVTDPEAFLATGREYLVSVLTGAPAAGSAGAVSWKLVVLEDSGELLAADARERTGQALSRLLNVTDACSARG